VASLEQLDTWGGLDALDVYGLNLEQLDQVTLHATDGAASISITGTLSAIRELTVQASVVGAAGVTASMKPIRAATAAINLAVTQSSSLFRVRSASASESLVLTTSALASLIRLVSAAENVSMSTSASAVALFSMASSVNNNISATATGKVLGEDWTDVALGNEVWTNVALGSEVWTDVTLGNEVWANQ